jgi:hypothetical protein
MNVDDIESVTTELDDGLEIMWQFNLQYIVRMCAPQLLQLRRECGLKTVKMSKPDLMESMILQLYDQFPSQASAPNHGKVKGLNYARMDSMAGSLISDPILTKSAVQDVTRCKERELANAYGMNGNFIKTKRRVYAQGHSWL